MGDEGPLDPELLGRVRRLREDGMSVKQIARTLGEKPKVVAPLVCAIAASDTRRRRILTCSDVG